MNLSVALRCRASCSPWSACPTATPGAGRPTSCPRRRRAGGPPGSSPRRARAGACRASGCGRPCRSTRSRGRRCRPGRSSPGSHVDLADLARRHLHRGVVAFLGHELHRRPGAARDLAALAGPQLHVVHHRAERDVLERQALPGRMSTASPATIVSPTFSPPAAGCSASRRRRRSRSAIRAERFGSYSIVATFAGMSCLSRLKSMMRYSSACARRRATTTSARRGCCGRPTSWQRLGQRLVRLVAVISSNTCTVWNRRPGDVGLYLRMGMIPLRAFQELGQLLAVAQPSRRPSSSRSAGRRSGPGASPCRARSPCAPRPPSRRAASRPPLDVDLVRPARHLEHDRPAVLAEERRLLGDERPRMTSSFMTSGQLHAA
jgi:hypothetical protein